MRTKAQTHTVMLLTLLFLGVLGFGISMLNGVAQTHVWSRTYEKVEAQRIGIDIHHVKEGDVDDSRELLRTRKQLISAWSAAAFLSMMLSAAAFIGLLKRDAENNEKGTTRASS